MSHAKATIDAARATLAITRVAHGSTLPKRQGESTARITRTTSASFDPGPAALRISIDEALTIAR
jgi:hypothetical protein